MRLQVVIRKEGTVQNILALGASGNPSPLFAAAIDAVRQWVYQPTIVNGQPVEVTTTVILTIAPRSQPRSGPADELLHWFPEAGFRFYALLYPMWLGYPGYA